VLHKKQFPIGFKHPCYFCSHLSRIADRTEGKSGEYRVETVVVERKPLTGGDNQFRRFTSAGFLAPSILQHGRFRIYADIVDPLANIGKVKTRSHAQFQNPTPGPAAENTPDLFDIHRFQQWI